MAYISDYTSIRSHMMVKIVVPEYKVNPGDTPILKNLTFSDFNLLNDIEYDGDTYVGLGALMNISNSKSEINPSSSEVTITVSGIPNTSISEIVNSKMKGCSVAIFRAIYDPVTGATLDVNQSTGLNVLERFRGFVNNYALSENYDVDARTSDNTITIICKSTLDVMKDKKSGRLTNSTSWKKWYPDDLAMDRVTAIQGTSFNFGAPQ
jgi:hypothetical protein